MESEHDHKGYSEEKCIRCGWVMGHPPLNCNNDNTPHVFPSQLDRDPVWMDWMAAAALPPAGMTISEPFIVGVRQHNSTWFAHFKGIESDGEPKWSVPAVIEELRQKAESEAGGLRRQLKHQEEMVARLPPVAFPEIKDEDD